MTPSSTTQGQLDALRERYLVQLGDQLQELEAHWHLLAAGDWSREHVTALHYQAHMLAGSATTFGMHALGAVAQQLAEFLVPSPAGATAVWAESRAKIGALVATLVALAQAGADVVSPSPVLKALPMNGRSERQTAVLLVEDDPAMADHLALQLEHFGYRAIIMHELAGLEQSIDAQAPAAIILDIVFPEGDLAGPQRMAAIQPGGNVPVVFLSQRSDFEARLWAVRAGGKAYLTKPTDIDTLVSTLDALTGAFVPEPYRVLIVDDTRMMSALYEATLRDAGMLTVALNDPTQIMRAIDEFQPDLLLLDMYMPNCTGTEVAALIRQQTTFISLPIVFLSGEHDREQQLAALDQGGDDFLTKPITPAQLVSAVNSRARRARSMRAHLNRDGLTGLLTHASIKEQAMREIVRAQRYGTGLSVAMIDLDHFKQINDRYGHAAGDRVLKGLARLMHQRLRMSDSIGRYGGEEFLIILPHTTGPAALRALDDVRARFAMIGHQLGDGEAQVTFSGGVASLDSVGEGSHLLEAADLALYAAKHAGRNQIVCFEQRPLEHHADPGAPLPQV